MESGSFVGFSIYYSLTVSGTALRNFSILVSVRFFLQVIYLCQAQNPFLGTENVFVAWALKEQTAQNKTNRGIT